MIYYYKLQKYIIKNNLIGGIGKKLPNQSNDLEIYFILQGGKPTQILSLITNEFLKIKDNKYILGLRSIIKPSKINFKFISHNHIEYPPVSDIGGYTAIYELQNEYNKKDITKYILRLFERKSTYSTESNVYHMCDKKKIKEEYITFNKYMIDIYYYGILKIHETGKARETNIDYIITKIYNTSKTKNINEFSRENKILFLKNNIEMLFELQKNNCFLGDYKLSNIGWDDELNIYLIDYDSDSIIKIDNKLLKIVFSNMINLSFVYTYIPNYLTVNKKYMTSHVNNLEISKYDKYSVGGLIKIIEGLELDLDLINEFKLNDPIYENILSYEQMLINLNKIK
jgi:hypothetical protein